MARSCQHESRFAGITISLQISAGRRRPVQIASTAWHFSRALRIVRSLRSFALLLFIAVSSGFLAIHHDLQLAALRLEHDVLPAHAAHHVERLLRLPPQGQFLHVVRDAPLDGFAHLLLDGEVALGRADVADPAVRTLVVVVLHPVRSPFYGLLYGLEAGALQELLPQSLPEPLDLPLGHGVMRPAEDVFHMIAGQRPLKAGLSLPGGVLPPLVRKHLLGRAVLRRRPTVDLQNILRGLATVDPEADDEPGVVVDERNRMGVVPVQLEGEEVTLPELIGRGPLEEPRFGPIPAALLLRGWQRHGRLVQRTAHSLRARRQEERPLQPLRDPPHPESGVLLLDRYDRLVDGGREFRFVGRRTTWMCFQPGFTQRLILLHPVPNRLNGDLHLLRNHGDWKPLLDTQSHRLPAQLRCVDRMGRFALMPQRLR